MSHFSVKVLYKNGSPAADVGVMINYGIWGGCDEKRSPSNGWVEFHNSGEKSGTIRIQCDDHVLSGFDPI